jgi:hypothetical protein
MVLKQYEKKLCCLVKWSGESNIFNLVHAWCEVFWSFLSDGNLRAINKLQFHLA